jgi:hypothetical protein
MPTGRLATNAVQITEVMSTAIDAGQPRRRRGRGRPTRRTRHRGGARTKTNRDRRCVAQSETSGWATHGSVEDRHTQISSARSEWMPDADPCEGSHRELQSQCEAGAEDRPRALSEAKGEKTERRDWRETWGRAEDRTAVRWQATFHITRRGAADARRTVEGLIGECEREGTRGAGELVGQISSKFLTAYWADHMMVSDSAQCEPCACMGGWPPQQAQESGGQAYKSGFETPEDDRQDRASARSDGSASTTTTSSGRVITNGLTEMSSGAAAPCERAEGGGDVPPSDVEGAPQSWHASARFLQHYFRRARKIIGARWTKGCLAGVCIFRPVKHPMCAHGLRLASDEAFDRQRSHAESLLDWQRQYPLLLKRFQSGRSAMFMDLFCKAGGVTEGGRRAGVPSVGVDHEPQPSFTARFGGESFELGDATEVDRLRRLVRRHDPCLIWASPPCQDYSTGSKLKGFSRAPRLIGAVRDVLIMLWEYLL